MSIHISVLIYRFGKDNFRVLNYGRDELKPFRSLHFSNPCKKTPQKQKHHTGRNN